MTARLALFIGLAWVMASRSSPNSKCVTSSTFRLHPRCRTRTIAKMSSNCLKGRCNADCHCSSPPVSSDGCYQHCPGRNRVSHLGICDRIHITLYRATHDRRAEPTRNLGSQAECPIGGAWTLWLKCHSHSGRTHQRILSPNCIADGPYRHRAHAVS